MRDYPLTKNARTLKLANRWNNTRLRQVSERCTRYNQWMLSLFLEPGDIHHIPLLNIRCSDMPWQPSRRDEEHPVPNLLKVGPVGYFGQPPTLSYFRGHPKVHNNLLSCLTGNASESRASQTKRRERFDPNSQV